MVSGDSIDSGSLAELRIGVFVCDCGTNIAGVIDVPAVVEYARTMDNVVISEEGKWICSVDYLSKIKEYISEENLNRVVVACCTPRTHEPTFKATIKEAGLNPFLLEFVSIREQSSWVHKTNPEQATEKAKDLVRMGVAKARLLVPGEELRLPVGKECLVIGGGIAGLTSALALGDLGFKVLLVEKTSQLGGMLNKLYRIAPGDTLASDILQPKIDLVKNHENITIFTNTEIAGLKGYVGNFKVQLKTVTSAESRGEGGQSADNFEEHAVSTIIVATGMTELEPFGQFCYGKHPGVVTQLQFEEMLKANNARLSDIHNIAFINCVNSRNAEHGCCNVGCLASIKNIKNIKELNNNINTYLFFRDFNITGCDVQYHYNNMDKYSAAFRYPDDKPPVVRRENKLSVQAYDILTGGDVKVDADLVVLATGFKGDSTVEHLKGLLKVSTNADGFFQEAHVKLRPLDFANEGIFVCGCARSPKDIRDTLDESLGAAMRAAIPMNKSYIETEGIVADINADKCISCGLCLEVCAFGAVESIENKSEVIQAICKGCGTCATSCPGDAISITDYSDEQILAQVEAVLAEHPEDKIVAFACHWCALGAVDNAGMSRFEYPPNVRIIRVMCAGRVDPQFILHAFQRGAAGVLVAGCEIPTCHYISGNHYASKKVQVTKKLLDLAGINPNRLRLEWLSAAQGPKFAKIITELTEHLTALGPLANDNFSELDLSAAFASVSNYRLKILATKLTDFEQTGNKYHELFSAHELERLTNDIVYDEFVANKILRSLKDSSKSVKVLSDELELKPSKALKCILDLKQSRRIKFDKITGTSPSYICTTADLKMGTENVITNPGLDQTNVIPPIDNKFDNAIIGTTVEGLNKALELATAGKKVCVIAAGTSFSPGPLLIANQFSEFEDFNADYCNLIEKVYNNENITVFRNSIIEQWMNNGSETSTSGNQLTLMKRATFVDENKCDNCGKCIDACPVKLIDFEAFGLANKHAIYRPLPNTESNKFAIAKGLPYCQVNCPIMMDVRGYIGRIADGDIPGASKIIQLNNPLPDICGKVCDHKCESTCARGYLDEPLEIRKLKRYAIEKQYEEYEASERPIIGKPSLIKNRDPSNKVAIIGSGPAGLAAAHDLAYIGYPVTIFEALSEPGGMLRVGIPDYRLPPEALQRELEAVLELGVELKLNTPIGPDQTIAQLKEQGYKAVFIAVGAHKSLKLGIEGEKLDGVINGVEFLREFNLYSNDDTRIKDIGKNIAVIGGGNVALDCARTVRRLGAENVHILYRRTEKEMPAAAEELVQCKAEGIEIQYLISPKRILEEGGKVKRIECQRNELGAPDASGRRRPVPIDGSEFTVEVDTVITAIGQQPNLSVLAECGDFDLTPRSTFMVNPQTGATNIEGVFAGGDAVAGPDTVIGAIKGGKAAARGIDEYLSGNLDNNPTINEYNGEDRTEDLELLRLRKNQLLPSPEPKKYRSPERLLGALERISNFSEVELPITQNEAMAEAARCLSCRMCIGCGVCQAVCPQDAIDYTMQDEHRVVQVNEVLNYPVLEEGGFHGMNRLRDLYKNSLNAITPMELEYMLRPESCFAGKILRPYDGEVPLNIAFINLPTQEFITDNQKKMIALELEYMLKLIKYIKAHQPEINIRLFTNSTSLSAFPERFMHLEDNLVIIDEMDEVVEIVVADEIEINETPENNSFEIKNNGKDINFELLVVGAGLRS